MNYEEAKQFDILEYPNLLLNPHPAIQIPFEDLYKGLMEDVVLGRVNRQVKDELELFNYNSIYIFENGWSFFALMSRGLILCPSQKKIVALPFPKFFNLHEMGYVVPKTGFQTSDKYDGSLGILYYWNNDWHVATRGSFESDQAIWANEYLHNKIDYNRLRDDITYLTEIIYPENRIVINYDFEGLVLLSAYNCVLGVEYPWSAYNFLSNAGFKLPKQYSYDNVDDLVKICETLPHDEEGFVVQFENGFRVKIKGIEYVRIHKLMSNVTPINIWRCMINGDDIYTLKASLPEEFRLDIENITDIFDEKLHNVMFQIKIEHEKTKHLNDKELGLYIKEARAHNYKGFDITALGSKFLFLVRKKDLFKAVYSGDAGLRKKVFNLFNPKGNVLEGYVPGTFVKNFTQMENVNSPES